MLEPDVGWGRIRPLLPSGNAHARKILLRGEKTWQGPREAITFLIRLFLSLQPSLSSRFTLKPGISPLKWAEEGKFGQKAYFFFSSILHRPK